MLQGGKHPREHSICNVTRTATKKRLDHEWFEGAAGVHKLVIATSFAVSFRVLKVDLVEELSSDARSFLHEVYVDVGKCILLRESGTLVERAMAGIEGPSEDILNFGSDSRNGDLVRGRALKVRPKLVLEVRQIVGRHAHVLRKRFRRFRIGLDSSSSQQYVDSVQLRGSTTHGTRVTNASSVQQHFG